MNELRVVSGFHRGVSLMLDEDPIVIGASLEADLVLTDPGVVETHIKIEPVNGRIGRWRLVCLNGDVKDEDGNKITTVNILMNKRFNLAGVWIQFCKESAPWPSNEVVHREFDNKVKVNNDNKNKDDGKKSKVKRKSSISKIVLLCMVACVGFLTVTHATVGDNKAPEVKLEQVVEKKNEEEVLAPVFKKMLKERGLQNVEMAMAGNVWNLEGAVELADIDKLKRMLVRFSKRNPHSLTIKNNVIPKDYTLPFEIVKVISGPYGHVEANDGHKLYLGSEHKGMTLVSITKNELIFSGKNNITVNW